MSFLKDKPFYQLFSISEFSKNVFVLITGSVIAQAIPLAISPILTRIYDPKDFGILAVYIAAVHTIGVIATARYEFAIVLPKRDKDAVNILVLSLSISIVISFLSLIIIFLTEDWLSKILNNPSIKPWLYFMPASILFTGLNQSLNLWLTRKKKFKIQTSGNVSRSLSQVATQLSLSPIKNFNGGGLILAFIFSQIVNFSFTGLYSLKEINQKLNFVSKRRIILNAKKYKDFPFLNSLQVFIDMIQSNGIIFIITSFFNSVITGYFSLTLRIIKAPVQVVGSAISHVLYQQATESYQQGKKLRPIIVNLIFKLVLLGTLIFIPIFFWGAEIFEIVFGKEWKSAGQYASILSPWIFINFISNPIATIPLILNKQKKVLTIATIGNTSALVGFFLTSYIGNEMTFSLKIYSIIMTTFHLYLIIWVLNMSNNKQS